MKALQKATKQLPSGSMEHFAAEMQAKVIRFEEDKHEFGGLTA